MARAGRLDRAGYRLVFAEGSPGPAWMTRAGSTPTFRTGPRRSTRPRGTSSARRGCGCSSRPTSPACVARGRADAGVDLQTGSFSGARFVPGADRPTVRGWSWHPQPDRRLWTATAGHGRGDDERHLRPDLHARVLARRRTRPEGRPRPVRSASSSCTATPSAPSAPGAYRCQGAPGRRLREDIVDVWLEMDATTSHTYAATWDAAHLLLRGRPARARERAGSGLPAAAHRRPLRVPHDGERSPGRYPKSAVVHEVRAYEPAPG